MQTSWVGGTNLPTGPAPRQYWLSNVNMFVVVLCNDWIKVKSVLHGFCSCREFANNFWFCVFCAERTPRLTCGGVARLALKNFDYFIDVAIVMLFKFFFFCFALELFRQEAPGVVSLCISRNNGEILFCHTVYKCAKKNAIVETESNKVPMKMPWNSTAWGVSKEGIRSLGQKYSKPYFSSGGGWKAPDKNTSITEDMILLEIPWRVKYIRKSTQN